MLWLPCCAHVSGHVLCRWSGSSALLESLLACLHASDTPPDIPLHSPPFTPQNAPAIASQPPLTTPTTAAEADPTSDTQWGLFKTQRLALLVIATLLQQQQQHVGVMLHMVQTGQRSSDGGLCHCLLELVESVTRDTSGDTAAHACACVDLAIPLCKRQLWLTQQARGFVTASL